MFRYLEVFFFPLLCWEPEIIIHFHSESTLLGSAFCYK